MLSGGLTGFRRRLPVSFVGYAAQRGLRSSILLFRVDASFAHV